MCNNATWLLLFSYVQDKQQRINRLVKEAEKKQTSSSKHPASHDILQGMQVVFVHKFSATTVTTNTHSLDQIMPQIYEAY